MSITRFVVFVEGSDDVRLVERICTHLCSRLPEDVYLDIRPYCHQPLEWVRRYIRSIRAMGGDYLYLRDLDDFPCATARKAHVVATLGANCIDEDRVVIVKREIESWYLAVAPDKVRQRLHGKVPMTTDSVSKEDFTHLLPPNTPKVPLLVEIVDDYSLEEGFSRNSSLAYLVSTAIPRVLGESMLSPAPGPASDASG